MTKVVVLLLAACRLAHADDDEPAVTRAGEANLELPKGMRSGVQFSGAIGGSLALGFSMSDASGSGGAYSFRLGEPMTPSWVLTFELAGSAQLHRTFDGQTKVDNDTNLLVGAQYYPSDSFFIRAAFGLGTYIQNGATITGTAMDAQTTFTGPAFAIGGGLEVIKLKHFVFDVELFDISMINRDGVLATTAVCVGLTIN